MGSGVRRSRVKTRNFKRDLDQIQSDVLSPKHLQAYKITKSAEDLPAGGQFYCIECARWFDTAVNLTKHQRGKPHKRQVKAVKEEQYTQKEAEAAVGLRTDNKQPGQAASASSVEVDMTV